ncbi:UDP-N-acetylglucosamine 2-epimerase [Ferrimonas lipolytica]|nr:UDP-N-acetylglucosamine 2-epimerase [Ferrimonas lipolytica]
MKKILFITGTRADYGKLKSLISMVNEMTNVDAHLFVTGMHMLSKYGMTAIEVERGKYSSIYKYINQNSEDSMDVVLAKTIAGLSDYVKELKPDLILVHGDRVEALAGAIVGSLNNILVGHIEGGEVSGTIDELIRHSVSKMAHLHFVCNQSARSRLLQLGEKNESIHVIGSPDLDVMNSDTLPTIEEVKRYYQIPFDDYGIVMYHPVTTELAKLPDHVDALMSAIEKSDRNFVVVYPNNDHGSKVILDGLLRLEGKSNVRVFPSLRFESFLRLLKNAKCIIGNSSAGVREAPFYGLPSVNIGTRQNNRASSNSIINVSNESSDVVEAIEKAFNSNFEPVREFGNGNSKELFAHAIKSSEFWTTPTQKIFIDR